MVAKLRENQRHQADTARGVWRRLHTFLIFGVAGEHITEHAAGALLLGRPAGPGSAGGRALGRAVPRVGSCGQRARNCILRPFQHRILLGPNVIHVHLWPHATQSKPPSSATILKGVCTVSMWQVCRGTAVTHSRHTGACTTPLLIRGWTLMSEHVQDGTNCVWRCSVHFIPGIWIDLNPPREWRDKKRSVHKVATCYRWGLAHVVTIHFQHDIFIWTWATQCPHVDAWNRHALSRPSGKRYWEGGAASTHLGSGLPLSGFVLRQDVLQADFLQFTLLGLGRPFRQLLLSVHVAQAPTAQVPARVKVVRQCSTACSPSQDVWENSTMRYRTVTLHHITMYDYKM